MSLALLPEHDTIMDQLRQDLSLVKQNLKERLTHLPEDLLPSAQGFIYLLNLCEAKLPESDTAPDDNEAFDVTQALIEHVDSFLEVYQLGVESVDHFESLLTSIYEDLPTALRNQFIADALKIEAEPMAENSVVDDLKASITPEALANIQTKTLSPTLIQKLKSKAKLKPKQIMQVLAACAALSLPSDELQKSDGPEGIYFTPESLAQSVKTSVAEQVNLQWTPLEPSPMLPAVEALPTPAEEAPFELLRQASFPVEVVAAEAPQMKDRLQFVLDTPERRELFETLRNNPDYRDVVALIGVIESNLDVDAVSHSGAIGIMQDMGGLQGAFGHPDTVEHLAAAGLMPVVEDATYNRIISLHQRGIEIQRGTLLDYLIAQRQANTPFWQTFETEQAKLLINSESAAAISAQYLEDLQAQAMDRLPINNNPLEALNFAVMSYNLGMTHLHTLRRIMAQNDVLDFNTHTVLTFINRPDFHTILRNNNLGQLYDNYEEAKHYLARYINLQALVAHNNSRI